MNGPKRFETIPPGFVTATNWLPGVPIRLAGTNAVNCAALTKVVAKAKLPIWAVAPERNPVPLTVRVKPGPPAVTELGLREAMEGALEAAEVSRGKISAKQVLAMRATVESMCCDLTLVRVYSMRVVSIVK